MSSTEPIEATRSMEQTVEREAGVSPKRERRWGIIGGAAGSLAGTGAFLISWLMQGESLASMISGGTPEFFKRREVLPIDWYFVALVVAGGIFQGLALYHARVSRHPRSDCYGAGLTGVILSLLGGILLFARLRAALA